jgi:hypothetical protein
MAYAGTATIASKGADGGRNHWAVTIAETEAAAGSEWSVVGLPKRVTIFSYKATLTSGGGTTINPILGSDASFTASTQDHIATNATTAAHINDQTILRCYLPSGTLYGRSTVDADTDNAISTEILIVEGWAS